jgi:hypothetical protein
MWRCLIWSLARTRIDGSTLILGVSQKPALEGSASSTEPELGRQVRGACLAADSSPRSALIGETSADRSGRGRPYRTLLIASQS